MDKIINFIIEFETKIKFDNYGRTIYLNANFSSKIEDFIPIKNVNFTFPNQFTSVYCSSNSIHCIEYFENTLVNITVLETVVRDHLRKICRERY